MVAITTFALLKEINKLQAKMEWVPARKIQRPAVCVSRRWRLLQYAVKHKYLLRREVEKRRSEFQITAAGLSVLEAGMEREVSARGATSVRVSLYVYPEADRTVHPDHFPLFV